MNHQAMSKMQVASEIIAPHDGVGGWTPTPRKDSAASKRMFVGIRTVE